MALYRQDYAGKPEMVDVAVRHARALLSDWDPVRARPAEQIVRALAEDALTRTLPSKSFTLTTDITAGALRFEVTDPGEIVPEREPSVALATVSALADSCGSVRAKDGRHMSWAELRDPAPATHRARRGGSAPGRALDQESRS